LTLHIGAASQGTRSLCQRLGYHEEELLITKAMRPATTIQTGNAITYNYVPTRHEEFISMQHRFGESPATVEWPHCVMV
jgi:hypothetical protein